LVIYSPVFSKAQVTTDSTDSRIFLELHPKQNLDTNSFNVFPKFYNRKKVVLALSGGGARGLAQIGILKSLEEHKIQIDMIVGTSVGAIIGGLYSSGYTTKELDSITHSIDWKSKLSFSEKYQREFLYLEQKKTLDKGLFTISLDGLKPVIPTSLSSGHQISETLNLLFLNARFKPHKNFLDLKNPFIAVATDLDNGKKIMLDSGNITDCVKASFTFPLLYSPTQINGLNLVDGGLTANIPVEPALDAGADFVIAVNSTSPLKTTEELKDPINTADQIISITMEQLNIKQLSKADIVITPDIGSYSSSDFRNIDFLIKKGYDKTNELERIINNKIDSLEMSSSPYKGNFAINPKVIINSELVPDSLINEIKQQQQDRFVTFVQIEKTLKSLYDIGYFYNVNALVRRDLDGLKLIYEFQNNPVLNGIKINNLHEILDNTVHSFEMKYKGKVLNNKLLYCFYLDLLKEVKDNNLSASDILKFKLDYQTNTINIDVSDGSINKIFITGNIKTEDNVILREIVLSKGNIAYKNNLKQSLQNIFSTNLFLQLSLQMDYDKLNKNPNLNVNVIEKSSRNISFAFRADNERNLQLLVDLRNGNLFGTNNELGATFSGGLRDRELKGEIKSNRFFNTIFTYNLSGYYRYKNIFNYSQQKDFVNNEYSRTQLGEFRDYRYGGSFLVGTQVERIGTIYSQISLEKLYRETLSGDAPKDYDSKILKLKFGGKIDTQNKYPFPDNGSNINYFYESSQNLFTEGISYSRLQFGFEQYFSLGKHSTIKPKFIFGFADKTTPLMEQFSLGGENSFFGMVEDELRGRQVMTASVEYRYMFPFKLFFDTYASVRYDLGQMWETADDIRFKDLRHGIGLSVLFDTPVGKASFSAGRSFIINKGLKEDSFMFGPYTFYFSIGYDL
jgi:NTE family protein